ncbi:RNA polymerase II-associated factor 1 [Vanrija pseudolonga]|uniref:RNA polymerase II-associated factor 1 n=1 Tax=Vanrija pseudolonga TaxID=143232 RepID=A0AAF1BMX4_9TREE|nr:RNA polymerase II-associated factor 1 [Vanrija pseudolonga]
MSKKSSKLDLLVRVRFENPLPDLPFPPKLLNVSTDIQRLGEPSYLNQLASTTQFPMLVDSEMGMPIDLNEFDGVWDGNEAALNPPTDASRVTDAADLALLTPLRLAAANGPSAPKASEVSWMRNSSYIQRRNGAVKRREMALKKEEIVDASEAAQIIAIDKTFADLRAEPAEGMKHPDPKRKHLRVVETYDILPDDDAWSNSYLMIKFPERPSVATSSDPRAQASSERLSRAILRPIVEDDQQIMEYFLPREEDLGQLSNILEHPMSEEALTEMYEKVEEGGDVDELFPNTAYERLRTYEVVGQTQPQKEVIVTFVEEGGDEEEDMFGDDDDDEDQPAKKKRKGVYFKEVTMKAQLRKTRARGRDEETRTDVWDKVRVGAREPSSNEVEARAAALQPVADPEWSEEQLRIMRSTDIGDAPEDGRSPDSEVGHLLADDDRD